MILSNTPDARKFIELKLDLRLGPDECVIGLTDTKGKIIAAVSYHLFNEASVVMNTVIEGRLTREFIWYAFHFPFNELRVKAVIGFVSSANLAAQKFDEHVGFVRQSTLTGCHVDGDLLLYVMRRSDCKWLDRAGLYGHRHGQEERTCAA